MSQEQKPKYDPENKNHQMIAAGIIACIEDGMAVWDTIAVVNDITRELGPGLMEIQREVRERNGGSGA